jgi:hypothetical protein
MLSPIGLCPGAPRKNAQKSVKNLDRFMYFAYCIFLRMCYNNITVKGKGKQAKTDVI